MPKKEKYSDEMFVFVPAIKHALAWRKGLLARCGQLNDEAAVYANIAVVLRKARKMGFIAIGNDRSVRGWLDYWNGIKVRDDMGRFEKRNDKWTGLTATGAVAYDMDTMLTLAQEIEQRTKLLYVDIGDSNIRFNEAPTGPESVLVWGCD